MAWRDRIFFALLLAQTRQFFCQVKKCWTNSNIRRHCCSLSVSAEERKACWDSEHTFELCCTQTDSQPTTSEIEDLLLEQPQPAPHITSWENVGEVGGSQKNSCWEGGLTEEHCCDPSLSETGHSECWLEFLRNAVINRTVLDDITYESCCAKHTRRNSSNMSARLHHSSTSQLPESMSAFEFVDDALQTGMPTRGDFAIPFSSSANSTIAESVICWIGNHSDSLCCDVTISPIGRKECWDSQRTFERCCSNATSEQSFDTSMTSRMIDTLSSQSVRNASYIVSQVSERNTVSHSLIDEDCWSGEFTELYCCDLEISPIGREECWFGIFSYDDCCPAQISETLPRDTNAKVHTENVDPVDKATTLVDAVKSPVEVVVQSSHEATATSTTAMRSRCWTGNHTEPFCCDISVSPLGRNECWDSLLTFEICCSKTTTEKISDVLISSQPLESPPSQSVLEPSHIVSRTGETNKLSYDSIEQDCWSGDFTEQYCCDINVSPSGREECWFGIFSFEDCCLVKSLEPYARDIWGRVFKPQGLAQQPPLSSSIFGAGDVNGSFSAPAGDKE